MSTHGLVIVKNRKQEEVVRIFSHYDGYPSGLGKQLEGFFIGRKVVCGVDNPASDNFNGMGCLAASLIKFLKDGIGSIYIEPYIKKSDVVYTYIITSNKNGEVNIEIEET